VADWHFSHDFRRAGSAPPRKGQATTTTAPSPASPPTRATGRVVQWGGRNARTGSERVGRWAAAWARNLTLDLVLTEKNTEERVGQGRERRQHTHTRTQCHTHTLRVSLSPERQCQWAVSKALFGLFPLPFFVFFPPLSPATLAGKPPNTRDAGTKIAYRGRNCWLWSATSACGLLGAYCMVVVVCAAAREFIFVHISPLPSPPPPSTVPVLRHPFTPTPTSPTQALLQAS